jgi:hypothetical protein
MMAAPIKPTDELPTTDEIADNLLDGVIKRGSPIPPLRVDIEANPCEEE